MLRSFDVRRLLAGPALLLTMGLAAGAEAKTTITFAAHYTNQQQKLFETYIAEYETLHPDIDVVYQLVSHRDYLQTVLTARIGGQSPDVYNLSMDWAPKLIRNGVLAEPPSSLAERVRRDYVPSTVEGAMLDGKLWGVPTEVANYLLVYNKQHFAQAGLAAPPRTWDELVSMAKALTKRGPDGKVTRAGFAYGNTPASLSQPYLSLLFSMGGDVFNADQSASALSQPVAVEALQRFSELALAGVADPNLPATQMPGGAISMSIIAGWRRATFVEAMGPGFSDIVAVAPIPAGPDWKALSYEFVMGVDANSPVKDEAWTFVDWMNAQAAPGKSSPIGDIMADLGGLTGSRPDIAAHPEVYADPFTKVFVEALDRSRAMPPVAQSEEIKTIIARAVEQAVWGKSDPAATLTAASAEIDGALAGVN